MNKLSTEDRVRVIAALVEGNSIRATVRMTGVAKNTVTTLLADLGRACAAYHDKHVRNLESKRIQCDEIWGFCYAKDKNLPAEKQGKYGYGSVWTWTGMDADSKLMIAYLVGLRDLAHAKLFMEDVAMRLRNRVQITTDGLKIYVEAVENAFGGDVDFAQLVKLFGAEPAGDGRYSPPKCTGCVTIPVQGEPELASISTSYVERQNLTMRMSMRRLTRLTNAFSKKMENLAHAVAIHFMHYNFCRIHQTLRCTPAMRAGLTKHLWTIADLVCLLDSQISN